MYNLSKKNYERRGDRWGFFAGKFQEKNFGKKTVNTATAALFLSFNRS
jgi:hypothetical protein